MNRFIRGLEVDDAEHRGFRVLPNLKNRHFFTKDWDGPPELRRQGGLYETGKLGSIAILISKGLCDKYISQRVPCHHSVVRKLRRFMAYMIGVFYCKCGRPGSHRGPCKIRFPYRTQKQIDAIKKLNARRKGKIWTI